MMKKDEELLPLWKEYEKLKTDPSPDEVRKKEVRNILAGEYYQIAQEVAERLAPKLAEITVEECTSYGVDGLYNCIDKFDLSKGNKFRTYASYRIRGAILDGIRKADWVPRLDRRRNNLFERERQSYYKEHGCYPCDDIIAKNINLSIEEYHNQIKKSLPVNLISVNSKPNNSRDDEEGDLEHLARDNKTEQPYQQLLRDEMFKKLLGKNFTRLERKIMYLHYYENLTMKDIAKDTDFSESRISQMHTEILRRLRNKISRNPKYSEDLETLFESI